MSKIIAVVANSKPEMNAWVADNGDPANTHYWMFEPQDAIGYQFDEVVGVGDYNQAVYAECQKYLKPDIVQ